MLHIKDKHNDYGNVLVVRNAAKMFCDISCPGKIVQQIWLWYPGLKEATGILYIIISGDQAIISNPIKMKKVESDEQKVCKTVSL